MSITRERLRQLVGLVEPAVSLSAARIEQHDGYEVEHLTLKLGDTEVRGILTRPLRVEGRLPAILYGHSPPWTHASRRWHISAASRTCAR